MLAGIVNYSIAKFFADQWLMRNSGLYYTIVQPGDLVDEPVSGKVRPECNPERGGSARRRPRSQEHLRESHQDIEWQYARRRGDSVHVRAGLAGWTECVTSRQRITKLSRYSTAGSAGMADRRRRLRRMGTALDVRRGDSECEGARHAYASIYRTTSTPRASGRPRERSTTSASGWSTSVARFPVTAKATFQ